MTIRPYVLRSLIGILEDICALALFVSHIPTSYCKKFVRRKREATDESDENSWICTCSHLVSLFRFALWILYGLPFITNGNYLFVTSMVTRGFLTELTYVIIYLVYADKKQRVYVYLVLMGQVIAYAGFFIGLRVGGLPQAFIAGVCIIFEVLASSSYSKFQSLCNWLAAQRASKSMRHLGRLKED